MATFTNEQLNLLIGKVATDVVYQDTNVRATSMDTREIAPGYVLQVQTSENQPLLSRYNNNNDQVRVDYWLNSSTGNLVVGYAGTYPNAADWRNNLNVAIDEYKKTTDAIVYLLNTQADTIRSVDATGHSQGGAPAQYLIYDLALAKAELLGTLPPGAGRSQILHHPNLQLNDSARNAILNLELGVATVDGLGGLAGVREIFGGYNASVGAGIRTYHVAARSDSTWDSVIRLGDGHIFSDGTMSYLPVQPGLDSGLTGFVEIHKPKWFADKSINYLSLSKAAYPTVDLSGAQGTADAVAKQIEGVLRLIEMQNGTAALAGGLLGSFVVSSTRELNNLASALNFDTPLGLIRDIAALIAITTPAGRLAYMALRITQEVANETPAQVVPESWDWKTTEYLRITGNEILRFDGKELSTVYITQPGDTLESVAARYGLTVDALAASSGLSANMSLFAGVSVTLPKAPVTGTYHNNPSIFNLTTDTQNLKPNPADGIGGSTGGQGLLGAGSGYAYTMAKEFVDEGGLRNVSGSAMATGQIRPGNGNESNLKPQMDRVRADLFQQRLNAGASLPNAPTGTHSALQGGTTTAPSTGPAEPNYDYYVQPLDAQSKPKGPELYGYVRLDERGNAIGMTLGAGQLYTDGTQKTKVSNGTEYLQFNKTKLVNGELVITDADYLLDGNTANTLSQQQQLNDPNKTVYIDPVSLDAGGDGIQLGATPVNFDIDADGQAGQVFWTAPTDPLLVMDINHDGRINNGSELIDLSDANAPLNLFTLDSNGDQRLDALDNAYAELQIWQDHNQDGYASLAERQSLSDLGITSIDLNPLHVVVGSVAGQQNVKGVVATYSDGSTRTMWDVKLTEQSDGATLTQRNRYSASIDKVTGSGQVALQAMSSLGVRIDLQGSGATQAIGSTGADTLLGTEADDWLTGGAGADAFSGGAGRDLLIIDADDRMSDIDGGSDIDTVLIADDRGVFLNLAQTRTEVVYAGYGDDVLVGGGADNYFIDGAAGNDLIIGGSADDVLTGGDGDDVIEGGKGNDLIRGGRGSDRIAGGEDGDVIDGGQGDDTINAGLGDDVIQASSGIDQVDGGEGIDILELSGQLEDYRFEATGSGTWRITDKKNNDGSEVLAGQVSDRDGVQQLRNVERFSYKAGKMFVVQELGGAAPLPVNDKVSVGTGTGTITLNTASLIANDVDFQSLSNPQLSITWVGDAVGGSVKLSGSTITFTPTAGYSGPMEFTYTIKDKDATPNAAPTISVVNDPTQQGPMKARVLLVPGGADMPSDPDFAKQWYLGAIDAPTAWKAGYTGKGVDVLVIEPPGRFGVSEEVADLNSADLKSNQSSLFVDTAVHSDHATAVAGVIGAARNSIGGVGVAYDVTLNSVSLQAQGGTLNVHKEKLALMRDYDIVNNSWGAVNLWASNRSASGSLAEINATESLIEAAATAGRNGLGTIMVYGAGNDRNKGYDSGLNMLTANPYTINVGAINRVADVGAGNALNKPFSERGANILVSAPGSSIQTTSTIVETSDGDVLGSSTAETQGTSFAAPVVSGVAALMLQANPQLTYRDVQTILALTAKKDFGTGAVTGTTWFSNKADDWNGVGMHFSADYGFGMVDADAAVRMAESWVTEQEHFARTKSTPTIAGALPDLGNQSLTFTITDRVSIEQVILRLNLSHERWSDLVIKLTSPQGTTSTLLDRPGYQAGKVFASNSAGEIVFDQALMSTHFRGESAVGTWTLSVQDAATGGAGSGNITASLDIVGTDGSYMKHYTVTDEYAGGWAITPPTTQASELNAAAMSQSVRLDLSGGASSVNGKSISLGSGLDRLVGGQGNDTLIGSAGEETLIGGWGNDTLSGGAGADELQGGLGNDWLDGGAGSDLLMAGQGIDTLTGGADADIFLVDGNASSQTIIKDFNAAVGGDTLRIRTETALNWASMTQTLSSGTLTIKAGEATIVLEGMGSTLTNKQLIGMANGSALPRDTSGNYASGNTIYVEVTGDVWFRPPKVEEKLVGYAATVNETIQRYYGIETVTTPGWHTLVGVSWRSGTDGADTMLEGSATPFAPENFERIPGIDKFAWERIVSKAGRPVFLGKAGDDELIGGARDEFLSGGNDNDTLIGGKGNDYLSGGDGIDEFVFNVGDGQDSITADAPLSGSLDHLTVHTQIIYGPDRDNEWGYRYLARPTSNRPLDSSDLLVFHTDASNLRVNTEFSNVSLADFTASTVLSYGNGDSVSFGAIYAANNLATATGIGLFSARFDSGSPISGVLDGKTISNASDAIDQAKYGSRTIKTLGGNDVVYAVQNNALNIDGGLGNDTIFALEGGNILQGGDGKDRIEIIASAGPVSWDTLVGGKGSDYLVAGGAGALMFGDYNDATASDTVSNYNDTLLGGRGADSIFGGYGRDIIYGGNGNDVMYGDAGDDVLSGDGNNDELHGGDGLDNLVGGAGNDYLYGDAGNDVLMGGDGDDVLDGGAGDDYFDSGSGHDTLNLNMSSGNDTVDNATGVDVVRIAGVSSIANLGLALLNNGVGAKISWGSGNSLTYTSYNLETQILLDNDVKTTLRAVFNAKGLYPDESFQFLGQYDLQLVGDTQQIGTLIGDADGDQLFGGPKDLAVESTDLNGTRYGDNNSAYWYVLGGAGADSIAGGKSGAFLDGGGGEDKIRASDGVTVLRDTFHGGNDTLIMPEGMVPETLRFLRVANPLQASSFYDGLLGTAPQTVLEQKLSSNSILPTGTVWSGQRYAGTTSIQHYDTLRVQSVDGKFTVDLIGYFESGAWKNSIANMLFTTVFDENGASKSYSIDSLIPGASKDINYKWATSPVLGFSPPYDDLKPRGPTIWDDANTRKGPGFSQLGEGLAVIGGESGTYLSGRVKMFWSPDIYGRISSTTVTQARFRSYLNNYSREDTERLNSGNYASNTFQLRAIALPDYILGFGGNDTIDAGGAYIVDHKALGSFIQKDYFSAGYYEPYGSWARDQVNGGGGDDTYRGTAGLHIISIDEENAGAEGVDTLDLSWLSSEQIGYGFNADGSGHVSFNIADNFYWYGNKGTITIDAGRNGLLQVDRIILSDKIINVREIINATAPELSVEYRPYGPDKLAYETNPAIASLTDERYWALATTVTPSFVVNGTPKDDLFTVPVNGVAYGAEGADTYLIDVNNTQFSVLMMDKGDDWALADTEFITYLLEENALMEFFAGGSATGASYLGKTKSEWTASGILPLSSNIYEFGGVWTSSQVSAVEFGKLLPNPVANNSYSLANWQTADGSFDDITDALVTWQTIDANGHTNVHHVVMAGLLDAAGHDITGNINSLISLGALPQFLSQGSDYWSSNNLGYQWYSDPAWDSPPETLHALGGNDTVAAYAHDVFDNGNYRGRRNIIYGESGDDSLDGGAGDDSLYGGADKDTLIGGFGHDYLNGGAGADSLIGGAGNDVYVIDSDDVIVEEASSGHRISVGTDQNLVFENIDTKQFAAPIWSTDSIFLLPGSEEKTDQNHTIGFVESFYGIKLNTLSTTPTTEINRLDFVRSVTDFNKSYVTGFWREDVTRTIKAPSPFYYSPTDTEINQYRPGPGWEFVSQTRTTGNDSLWVYKSIELHLNRLEFQVTFDSVGVDEVQGDMDMDLRDSRFANVENVTALGTSAHHLTGTDGDNVLTGNGSGSTLEGLAGNDVYIVFNESDKIIEAEDAGHDTLFTLTDIHRLADNVEDLYSKGLGLTLMGNALANLIVGDDQSNLLDGRSGADTLQGGLGDDEYVVSTNEDIIIEGTGGGRDTVWVSRNYTLGDVETNDIEIMRAGSDKGVFMKGNSLDGQLLVGASGEDTLDGGAGVADRLYGGAGGDTYVINSTSDQVFEDADAGNDTVRIAYNSAGNTAINIVMGTGNYLNIENAEIAGTGLFNLFGDSNNNRLTGNASNNTLDGGEGSDTLVGGAGNDNYVVDNAGDVVTEYANEGTDLVQSSVTHTLSANVENLTLTGVAAINGTGNALDNIIIGNSSSNTIDGGEGADIMMGGKGSDTYIVDNVEDVIVETSHSWYSGDVDTVKSSVTYKLGDYIENLLLTGTAAINGTGNDWDNIIVGNDANNVLSGGAGYDTLMGGAGDDTLIAGTAYDVLFGGAGSDTYIVDFSLGGETHIASNSNDGDVLDIRGVSSVTDLRFDRVVSHTAAEDNRPSWSTGPGNTVQITAAGLNGAIYVDLFNPDGSSTGYIKTINVAGTTLSINQIQALLKPTGTSGDDTLIGYTTNDSISGGLGNDVIFGFGGDDSLSGGAGNDQLTGAGILDGGAGNDTLYLDQWLFIASQLRGGDGDDTLVGSYQPSVRTADTTLDGGKGNDTFYVGASDTVIHRAGDGRDTVNGGAATNVLKLEGMKLSGLTLSRGASDNLRIFNSADLSGDVVNLVGYFSSAQTRMQVQVLNEAGTAYVTLDNATIDNLVRQGSGLADYLVGTDAADTLDGKAGNDVMYGGNGNDTLYGGSGNNTLYGGDGDDFLYGGADNDRMWGGTGNDLLWGNGGSDTLNGGAGNDRYSVAMQAGASSVITDFDATPGNMDLLSLDWVNPYQLLLKQSGNDLYITKVDNSSSVTVRDWFLGADHHIESIALSGYGSDGSTFYEGMLTDSKVQALVSAMAGISVPAGQTEILDAGMRAKIDAAWGTIATYSYGT